MALSGLVNSSVSEPSQIHERIYHAEIHIDQSVHFDIHLHGGSHLSGVRKQDRQGGEVPAAG